MRTAICLSGHIRDNKKPAETFLSNLVSPNGSDVFIHTWDEHLNPTSSWWHAAADLSLKKDNSKVNARELGSVYNPKKILTEPLKDFNSERIENFQKEHSSFKTVKVKNIKSMWYGVYNAFELMKEYEEENNFKYDAVIRCRPDLIIREEINISKYNLEEAWFGRQKWNLGNGCCDVIFFSNRTNMEYLCSLYNNFEKIFLDDPEFAKSHGSPEKGFRRYVEKSTIPIKEFICEKPLSILRVSGSTVDFGT